MPVHGAHQGPGARREFDAVAKGLQEFLFQSAQHFDPHGQRLAERDFAVHRLPGDPAHGLADAQKIGQFIDHLVADHRGFHVGDQQPLAPVVRAGHDRIDRQPADRLRDGRLRGAGVAAGERNIAGHLGRQPFGFAALRAGVFQRPARRRDGSVGQARQRRVGNQRHEVTHCGRRLWRR